jgi:16S rRNA (cytosine967-C5)-methyltransferase
VTPAARVQAAIEILDLVLGSARSNGAAADTLVGQYFRARRYAGSKDRAAVRALVFAVLRAPAVESAQCTGRIAFIAWAGDAQPDLLDHFGAGGHAPEALVPDERTAEPLPPRSTEQLTAYGEALERAPLDIRIERGQISRTAAQAALQNAGIPCHPTPFSEVGLRCSADSAVEKTDLYQAGAIDVQDEGSQLITLLTNAQPGMTVIDYCAGAGGKTLALAEMMDKGGMDKHGMGERGRLIAHDIDGARLDRLTPRAVRAGYDGWIELRTDPLADLTGMADVVLVDAPCTGSGTWRRNPEARLRPLGDRLAYLVRLQRTLIEDAADLLKPGGLLVYAVCSIYPAEGEAHLATLPASLQVLDWRGLWPEGQPQPESGSIHEKCLKLTPLMHGCDGFFIVCLQKA